MATRHHNQARNKLPQLPMPAINLPKVNTNPSYHVCQEDNQHDILDEDGYVAVDSPHVAPTAAPSVVKHITTQGPHCANLAITIAGSSDNSRRPQRSVLSPSPLHRAEERLPSSQPLSRQYTTMLPTQQQSVLSHGKDRLHRVEERLPFSQSPSRQYTTMLQTQQQAVLSHGKGRVGEQRSPQLETKHQYVNTCVLYQKQFCA